MKTEYHIVTALRALASKSWHGKGCRRGNCGSVCLCPPCHARVALERLLAGQTVTINGIGNGPNQRTTGQAE